MYQKKLKICSVYLIKLANKNDTFNNNNNNDNCDNNNNMTFSTVPYSGVELLKK